MSLFTTIQAKCPVCGVDSSFDLVHSVNADRRPDLRAEIVDRTFQQLQCPSCGDLFRVEPQFTYLHIAKKQFLTVMPSTGLANWADLEHRGQAAFERFYGPGSDPVAAQIGGELTTRVAFGWEAAHEKFVAADAGIDDVTLELAKLALLRTQNDLPVGLDGALRLVGVDEAQNLVFGLFASGSEAVTSELRVPRTLLDEIDAEAAWLPLREKITAGPFVDMLRLVIEPEPLAA